CSSDLSASVTCEAITFALHSVPAGRLADGVSVTLAAGVAEDVKPMGVPAGHSSENAPALALTDSLKPTVMAAVGCTAVAPLAGLVEMTVGNELVEKSRSEERRVGKECRAQSGLSH